MEFQVAIVTESLGLPIVDQRKFQAFQLIPMSQINLSEMPLATTLPPFDKK
jgi:hypothetical protein